jgi:hypothetical protein
LQPSDIPVRRHKRRLRDPERLLLPSEVIISRQKIRLRGPQLAFGRVQPGLQSLELSLCGFELGLRGVDSFPQAKGLERELSKLLVNLVTPEEGVIAPLLSLSERQIQNAIAAVELSLEVVPLLQSRISFASSRISFGSSCISFSQSVVPFGSSCISFVSSRIPFSQSVVASGHGGGKLALQEVKL